MKKKFKIETIYERGYIQYAIYQKKLFWGWKYISTEMYESEARKIVEALAEPPIYIETKK